MILITCCRALFRSPPKSNRIEYPNLNVEAAISLSTTCSSKARSIEEWQSHFEDNSDLAAVSWITVNDTLILKKKNLSVFHMATEREIKVTDSNVYEQPCQIDYT